MKASEIKPERLRWFWQPYLPLGKLSMIAGQPGQAKSAFTVWLAAENSRGRLDLSEPAGTIMLSAEDDPADTIVPRLKAAGADLNRVWIEPDAQLDHNHLADLCTRTGARLITVDPISAYFDKSVNAWKTQDIRAKLDPLRHLAAERSLAVLFVQHLNRRTGSDPLERIADSQGLPQLCRSVVVWGPDPTDPEGQYGTAKTLTSAKANLAKHGDSATFTITEATLGHDWTVPLLIRGTDRHIDAEDVIADTDSRTAIQEACDFLSNYLANGPQPATEAKSAAHANGISTTTLNKAKRRLKVHSTQERSDGKVKGWTWQLPGNPYTQNYLGHVDHLEHLEQGDLEDLEDLQDLEDHRNGHQHQEDLTLLADLRAQLDATDETRRPTA